MAWPCASPPEADGRAQDMVGDGKGVHQRHRHAAQLAAQALDQPLDRLGLRAAETVKWL